MAFGISDKIKKLFGMSEEMNQESEPVVDPKDWKNVTSAPGSASWEDDSEQRQRAAREAREVDRASGQQKAPEPEKKKGWFGR